MTLFEDRERAAEYGFTHAEELRFFATRDGIEALALWVASGLNLAGEARSSYVQEAVNRFVCGEDEGTLIASIRADLERRGKTDLARDAGTVFQLSVASAADRLHGRSQRTAVSETAGRDIRLDHHQHAFWGWSV